MLCQDLILRASESFQERHQRKSCHLEFAFPSFEFVFFFFFYSLCQDLILRASEPFWERDQSKGCHFKWQPFLIGFVFFTFCICIFLFLYTLCQDLILRASETFRERDQRKGLPLRKSCNLESIFVLLLYFSSFGICILLLAPTGALVLMMVYYIPIYLSGHFFRF